MGRRSAALWWGLVVLAAGCNVIFGVDDLQFTPDDVGGGGAPGDGGGGSSDGGGGATPAAGGAGGGVGGQGGVGTMTVKLSWGERAAADYQGVTADTELKENFAGNNFGGRAFFWTESESPQSNTGVVRFDLSVLPVSSVVTGAELHLWVGTCSSCGQPADEISDIQVHRLLEPWVEGEQDDMPGVANWNERASGIPWSSPGARDDSVDPTVFGVFQANVADTQYTVVVATALIQPWITDPASNFGFALINVGIDGVRFESSEAAEESMRPLLELSLEVPDTFVLP